RGDRLAVERELDGTRRGHGLAPREPLAPSLPRERSERGEGGERRGPGGGSFFPVGASKKSPPPLTPPRHSLREWGEGNPEAGACAKSAPGRAEGDRSENLTIIRRPRAAGRGRGAGGVQ